MIAVANPAILEIEEWQDFLSIGGLCRKAGCAEWQLPLIALKEVLDNSMDYQGAKLGRDGDCYLISDEGPGMSREEIGKLFSIHRPMTSSKRWRRGGRGALGNGLRIAVGAVRALDGEITVASHDGTFRLRFDEIGRTSTEPAGPPRRTGTEVRVTFSEPLDADEEAILKLSSLAPGPIYSGPANPHWFGMIAFRELVLLSEQMTIAEFAEQFGTEDRRKTALADLDREEIKKLHGRLRNKAPKRIELPGMGEDVFPDCHYFAKVGKVNIAGGTMPATVEAWVTACRQSNWPSAKVEALFMNRTWSSSRPSGSYREGIRLSGCELDSLKAKAPKASYRIRLAISAPYFEMTSDGKAPDLTPFQDLISKAIWKAARKAYDAAPKPEPSPKHQKTPEPEKPPKVALTKAVPAVLDDAVRHASSGFKYKVTARQIYYGVRDRVARLYGLEIESSYFTSTLLKDYVLTEDVSHWPLINYDARGSASEPHDGEKKIQLSTEGVITFKSRFEGEESAEKKFGAVLFIEKEQFGGLLEPLLDEFDMLLVEAKGQATVAEKDLLQWASNDGCPVLAFVDCDVAGFIMTEAIKNGSGRYQFPIPLRRVGLSLDQVTELGLPHEPKTLKKGHRTWLKNSQLDDATKEFLSDHCCELNHLTTEQMLDLLRRELKAAGVEKVMPSREQIEAEVDAQASMSARLALVQPIEEEIKFHIDQAEATIRQIFAGELNEAQTRVYEWRGAVMQTVDLEEIEKLVGMEFEQNPQQFWPSALSGAIQRSGLTVYREGEEA